MRAPWILATLLALPLVAHIGVNDVFFEGLAGPYPIYVTIRPPVVIPGIAEISIRSSAPDLRKIRVTPMTLTGAGSRYPPTPDLLVRSKDDPNLFTGGLWIMFSGSWQILIMVDGDRGPGALSVPVPASSQQVSTMDNLTGAILIGLLLLLSLGVVGILAAAVREARLPPGQAPDPLRQKAGRWAMVLGLAAVGGTLWIGRGWWLDESANYARSLYRPLHMNATLSHDHLNLQVLPRTPTDLKVPDDFIPDHNHLMHLYAIREPDSDAVFHIHPSRLSPGHFVSKLPAMPAGRYRLFADLVRANGFPETLTTSIDVPLATSGPSDSPDDAGSILPAALGSRLQVIFDRPNAIHPGQPVSLTFRVLDADGNPAPNLRPYLGMPAHLAIFRRDFTVFSHIHPHGNISMAAFLLAQRNIFPLNGNMIISDHAKEVVDGAGPSEFSFPFGFPLSGAYRAILQFGTPQRIETASFDIIVVPSAN